jgi:signal transduction histidine kinase
MNSFKLKFSLSSFALVTSIGIFSTLLIYLNSFSQMETVLGERLLAIAINSAEDVSIDNQKAIYKKYLKREKNLNQTQAFKQANHELQVIKDRNSLASEVYTIINPTWSPENFLFLSMSGEKHYIGNSMKLKPWMDPVFKQGLATFTHSYSDKEGHWISAMAPLKDENGIVFAALEVDFNIQKEVHALRIQYIKSLIFPVVLGAFLSLLFGHILGSQLTRKILLLTNSADQLSEHNLGHQIHDTGNDELSRLIQKFNEMSLELKRQEQSLINAQQEMTKKSNLAVLGELSASIAHEINNPLAVISANNQFTQRKIAKGDYSVEFLNKNMDQIQKMIDRIVKIVDGLRKFSRDGTKDKFTELTVDRIVNETLDLCTSRLEINRIDFHLDTSCLNQKVFGSIVQLSQVFLNMINNSIYAVKDLDERWIKIECQDNEDYLDIFLTDSGSGIPLEVQEKIFEPFYTTKKIGVGTGIGMSISHGIIKDHGGNLSINNDCPNTQFVIRFFKDQQEEIIAA